MQTNTRRVTVNTKIYTQVDGEAAARRKDILVGSIDQNGAVSFHQNPTTHSNAETARAECKRLASVNPGKTFIFVQLLGAERVVPTPTTVSI